MSLFSRRTEARVTNSVQGLQQLDALRQQLAAVTDQTLRAAEQEVEQSQAQIRVYTKLIGQEQQDITMAQARAAEARGILAQLGNTVVSEAPSFEPITAAGSTDYDNEHIVPAATEEV